MSEIASEDRIINPILSVEVASLLCMCGMCGHSFTIEHEALDQESGGVDAAHDFGDCPECGEAFNAQAVRFSAFLQTASGEEDGQSHG